MFKVGDKVKRKPEEMESGQWWDVKNNTGIFTISDVLEDEYGLVFLEDHRAWRSNRFISSTELEYI